MKMDNKTNNFIVFAARKSKLYYMAVSSYVIWSFSSIEVRPIFHWVVFHNIISTGIFQLDSDSDSELISRYTLPVRYYGFPARENNWLRPGALGTKQALSAMSIQMI